MFLQVLPPENVVAKASTFDNDLLFVLLGLAISVMIAIKISKFLSEINTEKPSKESKFSFLREISLFSYILFTK